MHLLRLAFTALALVPASGLAAERPNILWITAEDMSPTLGCYGDEYATTPHIDALAKQSVKYTHAFATAPVCSPSRSTLITGCYATSLGTHQMRSAFPIPDFIKGFPSYLRKAGYYTTNNVKTDYNTADEPRIIKESWDESSPKAHWRNRPKKDQPFFSVFNLMTSHQSRTMVWPYEQFQKEVQSKLDEDEIHDPAKAPLPPYYPDTPVIRKTLARYYDCVTAMDKQVGAILAQLEEDGLADDTIVFFYSDHGSGMPRHKRCLYDSGMHVPLVIRFPEKWKHLAPKQDDKRLAAGDVTDRLVSFVDFAPTVLSLAEVDIPDYMQGKPFLGKAEAEPREFVFGHRDRVDEVIDCARSVRTKRYLYIRNYMPHLGWNQPSAWPDQGEIRHEFYRLADREKMTDAQWQFAGPTRPKVEFFNCQRDPNNIRNLADDDEAELVDRAMKLLLEQELANHALETRDVGMVPEITLWQHVRHSNAWNWSREDPAFWPARSATTYPDIPLSADLHPMVAGNEGLYWAAISALSTDKVEAPARKTLETWTKFATSPAARIFMASALAKHGGTEKAVAQLIKELESEDLTTVLYAARAIELLGDDAKAAIPAMEKALARAEKVRPPDTPATVVTSGDQDLAMFIGFSTRAFLKKVKREDEREGAKGAKGDQGEKGESDADWTSLFDGKTLNGWDARAKGDVQAKDGEIQILSKGANLWLVHEDTFDDFELMVEAKMPDDAYNSGIGFRCRNAGKDGKGKPKGYQCEVARAKSGMIYAIGSGWVWPKGKDEAAKFKQMAGDCFDNDAWNKFRIRCEGDRIRIWINGVQTADVRDDRFAAGSVALQHHGKGGLHRFRNVKIRKLP